MKKLASAISNCIRPVFLTGAGISTESGIPDYRGTTGQFWGKYNVTDSYISNFVNNSESRRRCWQACAEFYTIIQNTLPNHAHFALAELEKMKRLQGIITQNVDGLHQKAGNSSKTVIEIHGTFHSISCLDCGKKHDCEIVYASLAKGTMVPYCDYCQGMLKPDTVFPGQVIAPNIAQKVIRMVNSAELLIVVGSSLEIQPAAYLPVKAKETGAKLAIINFTPTPYDKYSDYLIHDSAGYALSKIVQTVKNNLRS